MTEAQARMYDTKLPLFIGLTDIVSFYLYFLFVMTCNHFIDNTDFD